MQCAPMKIIPGIIILWLTALLAGCASTDFQAVESQGSARRARAVGYAQGG
jgi:hypothetical protein